MLGDILRKERERQNLSMKDVEEEISIRVLYIAAIEEGKYETVPGEVYLKGFIKTYANFLQLDGAELLKLYYEEKAPKVSEMPQILTMPAEENVVVEEEKEKPPEKMTLREKREVRRQSTLSMTKLFVGILLVACIGGVGYFMFGDAKQETKVTAVQTEKKIEPKEEAKAPAPAKVQKQAAESPAQQDKFIEIQAKYTGNCWTKVEADGKVVYEGTAKNGEVLSWKAEKALIITAGNAGAIEVVSKGKPLGKLGNPGEVVTKKFEKEASVANK